MRMKKSSNKPRSKRPKNSRGYKPTDNSLSIPSHTKAAEPMLPEREISFAELSDGSLVETIEDPSDSSRSALAVFRRGRIRIASRLVRKDQILVPIPRTAVGVSEMKLPRGVRSYHSTAILYSRIMQFLARVVDLPHEYLLIAASFPLYSWASDRLPTAVYLSIIGLPQSG